LFVCFFLFFFTFRDADSDPTKGPQKMYAVKFTNYLSITAGNKIKNTELIG